MVRAKLALENGRAFAGHAFGATGQAFGEVVFNTSMTGYQEVLTDPSYCGQIVTMTYPLIGNYGITPEDDESQRVWLSGFVVRELARRASNYRSRLRLEDFLAQHGVIGIQGVDTRSLVLGIRREGAMRGVVTTEDVDDDELVALARQSPGLVGRDLTRSVMISEAVRWGTSNTEEWRIVSDPTRPSRKPLGNPDTEPYEVVALDFGMKWNIARCLVESGCNVTIVPGSTPADEILARKPDGVFVSNGPGDPEPVQAGIRTIQELVGEVPIFGICLGHQLLGLALGAKTFKLKFGHRGANQPVRDERSGRIEITTQNHGFAVDAESLPGEVEATHVNLNDGTLEGLSHRSVPAASVQYHPEASAGPHDSRYLFSEFVASMDDWKSRHQPTASVTPQS